ncbi:DUF3592 domain-containing protein [Ruminococcus sp.]|uniref:DUF3592 domain-containing protein n=1 Tax=Ruminococcus sp. TaxID=41978 RepID=UPI0025F8BECF|nr:DUF3592 domain-containing protein [Ruminococcus sp.]MBQ8965014.1 DUF3592 domain-containing protein [Ruminococcus sp.]
MDKQLKTFLGVLIGLGIIFGAVGIVFSVREFNNVGKCSENVVAHFESSERMVSHAARNSGTYSLVTYAYEYDGHTFYATKTFSYPDVIPVDKELKLLIDPDNPAYYTIKSERYYDVLNVCDVVALVLFASAFAVFKISGAVIKPYI